jgi:Cdc6-like AAA superfamily ATPase
MRPSIITSQRPTQWIHKVPEWQTWLGTEPTANFVWLHGIPGCGKTVLASYLIEQVKEICRSHEDVEYTFYYCTQNIQDETGPFLRWVVSQLCRRSSFVPKPLITAYDERCEPSVKDLLKFLQILLNKFNRVFIILDAVDESKNREELLRVLTTMSRFQNVRLLATSRNYYDIETPLADISMSVPMSNRIVSQDIRLAVRLKLGRSKRLQKWRKFFPEMEDAITNGAQRMYVFPRRVNLFLQIG